VSRAATYDLYCRDAASGSARPATPQRVGIVGETVETDLDPEKSWYVWLQAINSGGKSQFSAKALGGLGRSPDAIFATLENLAAWLAGWPQNTPLSPYVVAMQGMDMGGYNAKMPGSDSGDGMMPVYNSFKGRYVSLDLDACTGATIGWGSIPPPDPAARPDKDKLVHLVLPSTSSSVMTPGEIMIGRYNFQYCVNLKTVSFPPNLWAISANAFVGCVSLEALDLPASLESISSEAFSGCSSLKTIVCRAATPPSLSASAFTGLPEDLVIKVPATSVDAYKEHTRWGVYAAKITALDEGE
jgi:hypothetical protein